MWSDWLSSLSLSTSARGGGGEMEWMPNQAILPSFCWLCTYLLNNPSNIMCVRPVCVCEYVPVCIPGMVLDSGLKSDSSLVVSGSASLFSRGSYQPRNWTWLFCIAGRFFTIWVTREAPGLQYGKREMQGWCDRGWWRVQLYLKPCLAGVWSLL